MFTRRTWPTLAAAAALIGTNWMVYIWAVNNNHVVEASLGYFINPLVVVLTGTLLLGERLTPVSLAGAALILCGVVIIAPSSGAEPQPE